MRRIPTLGRRVAVLLCAWAMLSVPALRAEPLVPLTQVPGNGQNARLGSSIAHVGDFTGDGLPDVLVGEPGSQPGATGRALLFPGGAAFGTEPQVFEGDEPGSDFGAAVSSAGDFNGDGNLDLLIGAPLQDNPFVDHGEVRVVFGGAAPPPPLILTDTDPNGLYGAAVASAGDFNKDGWDDIVVGRPGNSAIREGQILVFFGGPTFDNVVDLTMNGPAQQDQFGAAVLGNIDFNLDGVDDLVVGIPQAAGAGAAGQVWVFYGGTNPNSSVDKIIPGRSAADRFGEALCNAGDLNGDGADDLLVGAPNHTQGSIIEAGAIHIFHGGPQAPTTPVQSIYGSANGAHLGLSLQPAGDLNRDGLSDFLAAMPFEDMNPGVPEVRAYLGGVPVDNAPILSVPDVPQSLFGRGLASPMDLTGDGRLEFLVGAPLSDDGVVQNNGVFHVLILQLLLEDVALGPLADGQPSHGVAWGNVTGTGLVDLFVTGDGPNKLFQNLGNGAFSADSSGAAGSTAEGRGAVWADIDGDGDLDGMFGNSGIATGVLLENQSGSLVDVTPASVALTQTEMPAWADIDGDGDLDLYVARDNADRLFRNDNGVFVNITALPLGDTGHGVTALWSDVDGDGDPDLFVGTADGANRLYRNDGGGTFVSLAQAELTAAGSVGGAAFGDYDNDGDEDLFLAQYTGGGFNTTSRLLTNNAGTFEEDFTSAAVWESLNGRSAVWLDHDLDGDLDLYLGTINEGARLYENQGNGVFDIADVIHLTSGGTATGAATADYDSDGDPDLMQAFLDVPNRLYRNNQTSTNSWLVVELEGTVSSAVGAEVHVVAGGVSQMRVIRSGTGVYSQDEPVARFGLGSASQVDTVTVHWPSGAVQVVTGLVPSQTLQLQEPMQDCILDPPSLGFGTVEVGSADTLTFLLTNTGNVTLSGTLTPIGNGCAGLSFPNPDYSVAPLQSVTLTAVFAPTQAGPLSCSADAGCAQISFTGLGQTPQMEACQADRETVVFGEVRLGDFKDLGFTVENTGNVAISRTLSIPADCTALTFQGDATLNVQPGETQSFVLRYAPTVNGVLDCTVDVGCDSLAITGTGVTLSCDSNPRDGVNFGQVVLEETATLVFTIENTGTGLLNGMATLPDSCDAFTLEPVGAYSIAVGQTMTWTVTFTPTEQGRQVCAVDLGNVACPTYDLIGTGAIREVRDCEVFPAAIDFGAVDEQNIGRQVFKIRNVGTTQLDGTVTLDACAGLSLEIGDGVFQLDAGDSTQVVFLWSPPDTGSYACEVTFGAADDVCPPLSVTGRGLRTACAVFPADTLDFGSVAIGDTAIATFRLDNPGTEILTGVVESAVCANFTLVGSGVYSIAPGGFQEFTARFHPTGDGPSVCPLNLGSGCGSYVLSGTPVSLPLCSVSPNPLVFGMVRVESTLVRTVVLRNPGQVMLSGTISLPDSCTAFALLDDPDYEIEPMGSRSIRVAFTPDTAGPVSCELDLGPVCGLYPVSGFGIPFVTLTVPPLQYRVHQLWSSPVLPLELESTGLLEDYFLDALGVMSPITWRGFAQEGDDTPENPPLVPGDGYWINSTIAIPSGFTVSGYVDGFVSRHETGWSVLGSPTLDPVAATELWIGDDSGAFVPVAEAVSRGWISQDLMTYDDPTPDLVNNGSFVAVDVLDASTRFEAFSAHLLFAFRPVQVAFPPSFPTQGATRAGVLGTAAASSGNAWSLRLSASASVGRTASVVLGADDAASGGWDMFDRPAPPTLPGGSLGLAVDHRDWPERGGWYRVSRVRDEGAELWWSVSVSGESGPVRITWSDGVLPVGRTAFVRLADGTTLPLSPGRSFDTGGDARFELHVTAGDPPVTGALGVLRAARPNPFSRGSVQLEYVVHQSVNASLQILDVRGRRVRDFGSVPGDAGTNRLTWDGRDDHGRDAPAGVYYVRLRLGDTRLSTRIVRVP